MTTVLVPARDLRVGETLASHPTLPVSEAPYMWINNHSEPRLDIRLGRGDDTVWLEVPADSCVEVMCEE